jgi:hypothetical protein
MGPDFGRGAVRPVSVHSELGNGEVVGPLDKQDRVSRLHRNAIGHLDRCIIAVDLEVIGVHDLQAFRHDVRSSGFEGKRAAVSLDVVQGGLDCCRIVLLAVSYRAEL